MYILYQWFSYNRYFFDFDACCTQAGSVLHAIVQVIEIEIVRGCYWTGNNYILSDIFSLDICLFIIIIFLCNAIYLNVQTGRLQYIISCIMTILCVNRIYGERADIRKRLWNVCNFIPSSNVHVLLYTYTSHTHT